MIQVGSIYISPVKSLGLAQPERVRVDASGIVEDRRFHLIDSRGSPITQRQVSSLVQVQADFTADCRADSTAECTAENELLTLRIPGQADLEGAVELGEQVITRLWGRNVPGRLVEGDWSAALSRYCGHRVRLVRSDLPGQCYDEYPVSLISQASIDFLSKQSAERTVFEGKRFRPNFLLTDCDPHQEDSWLGDVIRIGPELLVQVVARDPRCAITTHHPESGERDTDTLRLILSYRPNMRSPYFGVYGVVVRPGDVSVGDHVVSSLKS